MSVPAADLGVMNGFTVTDDPYEPPNGPAHYRAELAMLRAAMAQRRLVDMGSVRFETRPNQGDEGGWIIHCRANVTHHVAHIAADMLEAIDARHYPVEWVGQGKFCHLCPEPWPCWHHRILHPLEGL